VAKGLPVIFLEEAGERSNGRQDKRQRGARGGRPG
jgi:hypothetical protein